MSEPWNAEFDVTPEIARTLIEGQFPELAPAEVEPFGEGCDNTVYLVNSEFVFRFPRRELGSWCLSVENKALPGLARRLPLPIPVPTFLGVAAEDFPWAFTGYPVLPGETADSVGLDDRQRGLAARPLGRFLRALHEIRAGEAFGMGAIEDKIRRLDVGSRLPQARDYLRRAANEGLLETPEPWIAILDDLADAREAATTCLVHGDLYARQILVDKEGRLTAVIDWGDMHVGDPANDLATVYSFFPASARGAFLEEYGAVDEATLRLARFRAIFHSAIVLIYGHDIADAGLAAEGRLALGHCLDSGT